MCGWMDECMCGWMDGWTGERQFQLPDTALKKVRLKGKSRYNDEENYGRKGAFWQVFDDQTLFWPVLNSRADLQ